MFIRSRERLARRRQMRRHLFDRPLRLVEPEVVDALAYFLENPEKPSAAFYLGVSCAVYGEYLTARATLDIATISVPHWWLEQEPTRLAALDRIFDELWPDSVPSANARRLADELKRMLDEH